MTARIQVEEAQRDQHMSKPQLRKPRRDRYRKQESRSAAGEPIQPTNGLHDRSQRPHSPKNPRRFRDPRQRKMGFFLLLEIERRGLDPKRERCRGLWGFKQVDANEERREKKERERRVGSINVLISFFGFSY